MVSGLVQGPDGQGFRVGVLVVLAPAVLVVVLLLLPERLVAAWELLGGPFGRSGVPQQERLVAVCRPLGPALTRARWGCWSRDLALIRFFGRVGSRCPDGPWRWCFHGCSSRCRSHRCRRFVCCGSDRGVRPCARWRGRRRFDTTGLTGTAGLTADGLTMLGLTGAGSAGLAVAA